MLQDTENDCKMLKSFLKTFKDITKNPEEFLNIQPKRDEKIKKLLKDIYDFTTKKDFIDETPDYLPELIIDDMDEEQIWQQLELKNNFLWPKLLEESSRLLAIPNERFNEEDTENNNQNNEEDDQEQEEESEYEDGNEEESENEDGNEEDRGNEDENEEESENEEARNNSEENYSENDESELLSNKKNKFKSTIVDDKFFKLRELEAFLNVEDKKEFSKQKNNRKDNDNGEEINYFSANSSDSNEEEENINYKDFFDQHDENENEKKPSKTNKLVDNNSNEEFDSEDNQEENNDNDEEIDEEKSNLDEENLDLEEENQDEKSNDSGENLNDNEPKSSYEQRQQRLGKRIQEFEERALGEKPWQLKGEIASTSRPNNSLLQEILEFDSSVRPAPIITEEVNQTIEDIIRQRIKDKAYDDVVRNVKPTTTPQELRKKLILDQEKSKESLAQIYEKEYQNEINKLNPSGGDEIQIEPKIHKEIKIMMSTLFRKLDALSNFHFAPKPIAPEAKIITNTPAINMEEVAPLLMSNAKLLAPEEIRSRPKGDVFGETERTKTDKNRERRHKKLRQKSVFKSMEQKELEKQKLGIPLTKKEEKDKSLRKVVKHQNVFKATEDIQSKSIKSSKSFFTQLQDTVSTKDNKRKNSKSAKNRNLSAKKLKL